MKKIKKLQILILFCISLLVIIYIHALYPDQCPETYKRRFTFIAPLEWNIIADGILQADQDFHTSTKLLRSEQINITQQIQTIRDSILTKPDGIITAATVDSPEFREVLHLAASEGIPVALIDSDLPDSERLCYIGTDNSKLGKLAAEDMIAATNGVAAIGVVVSDLQYPNQQKRLEAFTQEINDYPQMQIIQIIECHSEPLELIEKIPKMLNDSPEITALYLCEAMSSAATGKIISGQFESRNLTIIATDMQSPVGEFINTGIYYSSIAQNPWQQGYLAVQTLCDILDKKSTESVIYTDVSSIKKENLQDMKEHGNEVIEWFFY